MTVQPVIGKPATPVVEFTPSGSLAIIERLFQRAMAKGGKLTPQEALLGLDHTKKLKDREEGLHTARLRQASHD